jgi:hypothetical protein
VAAVTAGGGAGCMGMAARPEGWVSPEGVSTFSERASERAVVWEHVCVHVLCLHCRVGPPPEMGEKVVENGVARAVTSRGEHGHPCG